MRGVKEKATSTGTVRRSVALPRGLVEAATRAASPALRSNMNRLVIVALQEFVASRREQEFAEAMQEMAADPAIRRVTKEVDRAFRKAEMDGLSK